MAYLKKSEAVKRTDTLQEEHKQTFSLHLIKQHTMKINEKVEVLLHALTSAIKRGKCMTSCPLYFQKKVSIIHCILGCVGPRAVLDAVEKKKKPLAHTGNCTQVHQSTIPQHSLYTN
jgi:hypothetical protein